ncbi:MAG: LysM peptidoglycan-binding domain-containing protein [Anaerolineae bacterium]|nr:LysM peptidoglycan-binding domain-containing protein [Anaerolineae bacterium]
MNVRWVVMLLCALVGSALWTARPALYAQAPTEEPTKRPYVFPTPIFIPTYPNDTPFPPRATSTPTTTLTARETPTAEPTTEEQTYIVQPGDSLWIIAQKVYGNGAKYPLIAQANDITTTTRLRTGMVLKIPGGANPVTPTATLAPATPTATLPPTPLPTPTTTPTPAPSSGLTESWTDTAAMVLRVLAALCALAGIVSAVSAYLMYARAKRLQLIEEGKPPLRLS